jgi:hypothetical protein
LIKEAVFTATKNMHLLVENSSSTAIKLPSCVAIAKAHLVPDDFPEVPLPYSDDIRLRSVYIDYIEHRTQWPVKQFTQLFHNNGDFAKDDWSPIEKAWINPPWPFLSAAVKKLIEQTPRQWVFVLPKYPTTSAWYKQLHSADHIEFFTLPRNLATGYFTRFRNSLPEQDLPFPQWEVEIVYGTSASFLFAQHSVICEAVQTTQAALNSGWQDQLQLPEEFNTHREQLLKVLAHFQVRLDGSHLGLTTAATCPINLMDNIPFYVPQYRLSRVQQQVVDNEIADMLKLGIIEESHSPCN